MTVFILPTTGATKYRGKYPHRARYISGTTGRATGRHIELNDGTRLWSVTDRTPQYSAGRLADDYGAVKACAVQMTDSQYAELKRAAELMSGLIGVAGHARRARIEANARAICVSIQPDASAKPAPVKLAGDTPATGEPEVRRDNVEFHAGREAFAKGEPRHCPYLSGGTRAARWTLGWDDAEAESKAAKVRTIDCTPTWSGILSTLLVLLADGNSEGKATARAELAKMAALADERNALATALAPYGPTPSGAINRLWCIATCANESWRALPAGDGRDELRDHLREAGFRVA